MKRKSRNRKPTRVAVIGSQGVPPKYGGFETLVDNIIANRSNGVEYTIFCSRPDMDTSLSDYKGCRLRYLPLHAHGFMSVPYDILSMLKALRGYDAILVLGVSGCVFLPVFKMLSRARIVVNIDGLEHRRDKWHTMAKRFLKFSLDVCMRWADGIVSDNKGIQDYVRQTYGREARLIAYGGDHAMRDVSAMRQKAILDFYGLEAGAYDLSVCRIEPENNCHVTLEAYEGTGRTIVMVGNWNHSDYSRDLYNRNKHRADVRMLKAIYDLDILYALRCNARIYVHGHRAGGTNPSLVEAMFSERPIVAFDVVYNRETTQGKAYYYSDAATLRALVARDDLDGSETTATARREYIWKDIARQYEEMMTESG
jgi:glycosyltransferase involved in cell wall biosynthesis